MSEINTIYTDKYNIFVSDENNILYEFVDGRFNPYLYNFGNVVTCIKNDNCTFIYTDSSQIFFVVLKANKYEYEYISFNADIDSMTCYRRKNILLTIEDGIIYEYQFLYSHSLSVLRVESNWIYNPKNPNPKIIKSIDDYILIYYDSYCNVQRGEQVIASFSISEINFNFIKNVVDDEKLVFLNHTSVSFDDKYLITRNLTKGNINQTCDQLKICDDGYHYVILIGNIMDYFKDVIDTVVFDCIDYGDNEDFDCIDYFVKDNIIKYTNIKFKQNITIKNNGYLLIIGCENKYIVMKITSIQDLYFIDSNINFNALLDNDKLNKDNSLYIDINLSLPLIPQLTILVPSIYRLNSNKFYVFENVINNIIISYGVGVTRSVFNKLAIELDEVFDQLNSNSQSISNYNFAQIGKLLYFCAFEGNTKICKLPAYFFYRLVTSYRKITNSDIYRLFERFKDTPKPLYQQYLNYVRNPNELIALDIGITNVDDYLTFLFTENLNKESVNAYDNIVMGYNYFFQRKKDFNIIKFLPLLFKLVKLVDDKCIINFDFTHKFNTYQGNKLIDKYIKEFNSVFQNQELAKKLQIIQNITGNRYYRSKIFVVFDEDDKKDYEISTCNAELTLFLKNGKINVTDIIQSIAIEDTHIVDDQ